MATATSQQSAQAPQQGATQSSDAQQRQGQDTQRPQQQGGFALFRDWASI